MSSELNFPKLLEGEQSNKDLFDWAVRVSKRNSMSARVQDDFRQLINQWSREKPKSFSRNAKQVLSGLLNMRDMVLSSIVVDELKTNHSDSDVRFIFESHLLFLEGKVPEAREILSDCIPSRFSKLLWIIARAVHHHELMEKLIVTLSPDEDPMDRSNWSVRSVFEQHLTFIPHVSSIPIYCINLQRDKHRWLGLEGVFSLFNQNVIRFEGVNGALIPDEVRDRYGLFGNKPIASLAIWMSNIGVLEDMVSKGHDYILVIEDDGLPNAFFDIDLIVDIIPKDFDVCFVNDRICRGRSGITEKIQVRKNKEILSFLPLDIRATGSDGYIISKKGAQKMIDNFYKMRVANSFDWTLLSLGQKLDDCDHGIPGTIVKRTLEKLKSVGSELKICSLTIPAIVHTPMGYSAKHSIYK